MLFHKHYVQERKKYNIHDTLKIIIKTVKISRERVQIRQKLYVRIEFGQKIIVYNLLVRVNNDTTAWKKVI